MLSYNSPHNISELIFLNNIYNLDLRRGAMMDALLFTNYNSKIAISGL